MHLRGKIYEPLDLLDLSARVQADDFTLGSNKIPEARATPTIRLPRPRRTTPQHPQPDARPTSGPTLVGWTFHQYCLKHACLATPLAHLNSMKARFIPIKIYWLGFGRYKILLTWGNMRGDSMARSPRTLVINTSPVHDLLEPETSLFSYLNYGPATSNPQRDPSAPAYCFRQ